MAKVKNIAVALTLVAIMVAAASVPAASATATTDEFKSQFEKAIDAVVSAAPPAKRSEIEDATKKQKVVAVMLILAASGDEKKVDAIATAYKVAADAVIAAAPADKFAVMEKTFKEAAVVSSAAVASATPPAKRSLLAGASGDEKKVDAEAAYRRTVDAVNAAAPADKFTVMVKEALRSTA